MEFSFTRLGYLLKKQWIENQKFYLLGILAMAGIMSLALLLPMQNGRGLTLENQQIFFLFGLVITGFIFSTMLLNSFGDKKKGIEALMLPASATEKVSMAVIYSILFFPVIYFLTVYPVLILMHTVDAKTNGNINPLYFPQWGKIEATVFFAYFMLQSLGLLCSIMFRRFVFLKAAVLVFLTFFNTTYLNSKIAENSLKGLQPRNLTIEERTNNLYTYKSSSLYNALHFGKLQSNKHYMVTLTKQQRMSIRISGWLVVLFFWFLTWLKLRERQL